MSKTPKKPAVQSKSILQDIKEARTDFQKHAKGDEKLKNCIVPAPQFVIFDPPIPGFEARAEVRRVKKGERRYYCGVVSFWDTPESEFPQIVLTPVKRIEDLLPPCKVECWASQDEDGTWCLDKFKPQHMTTSWSDDFGRVLATDDFNPFGLPVSENHDWKSQLYHFTMAQGWKKCEAK